MKYEFHFPNQHQKLVSHIQSTAKYIFLRETLNNLQIITIHFLPFDKLAISVIFIIWVISKIPCEARNLFLTFSNSNFITQDFHHCSNSSLRSSTPFTVIITDVFRVFTVQFKPVREMVKSTLFEKSNFCPKIQF